jgi:hypothetical protein
LGEACQLRIELPARSAAQISAIVLARHGIRVAERTVREHLQHRGLQRATLAQHPHVFGRFEASRPNELWVGDVLIGPYVPHPRTASSRRALPRTHAGKGTCVIAGDLVRSRPDGGRVPGRISRRAKSLGKPCEKSE